MEDKRKRMVEINVTGRVSVVCHRYAVSGSAIQSLTRQVLSEVLDEIGSSDPSMSEINQIMDERILRLEQQFNPAHQAPEPDSDAKPAAVEAPSENPETPQVATESAQSVVEEGKEEEEEDDDGRADDRREWRKKSREERQLRLQAQFQDGGGRPDDAAYTQRLQDRRKPLKKLLTHECVAFKLMEEKRALKLLRELPGRDPEVAEGEILDELRNNLQLQIKSFIRKYQGGPWPSPRQQEEIRLEIAELPTIHSLITMTRQLIREQEEWLKKNKNDFVNRLLGR
jgi:hypothetical protein